MGLADLDAQIEHACEGGTEIADTGSVSGAASRAAESELLTTFLPSFVARWVRYGRIEIDGHAFAGLTHEEVPSGARRCGLRVQ